jgi:hypothetical protein
MILVLVNNLKTIAMGEILFVFESVVKHLF